MSIEKEISLLLYKIGRMTRKRLFTPTGGSELSFVQLQALHIIDEGHTTMSDLAHELHVSLPTASVLVDKLVNHKFVSRTKDPNDRRIVQLTLTTKGKRVLIEAMKIKMQHMKLFLGYMSKKDQAALRSILENLAQNLEDNEDALEHKDKDSSL